MKLFFIMMEKLMRIKKIILSVFTVFLVGTAMSVPVSAAKTTPTPNFGYVDILVNEESGLIFETRTATVDGRPTGTAFEAETCYSQAFVNEPAIPGQETSRTFIHSIYDQNHQKIATVCSTLRSVNSQADSWAQILDISASADESAEADYQITFDTSRKGADGYLYIYFDGAPAGTMHYKIFTEGTKENS